MMKTYRSAGVPAALTLLIVASGCASALQRNAPSDRVISRSELDTTSAQSLYGAIDELRPSWLVADDPGAPLDPAAGQDTPAGPAVYMNRLYLGTPLALAGVRVRDVVEVRLVPPDVARDRYGAVNPAGAIELVTRDALGY